MITGTVNGIVRQQYLENKWQQKKQNINSKKNLNDMTQEERIRAGYQEQIDKERESNKHADLYNKLKSGGKLSSEEIAYLEKNDKEALRKYKEDQAEKEAYERELKNCKTKEDVDRVKLNKLGHYVAQAKNIATDPHIPIDKKLELMYQLNDKLCRVDNAHKKFIESQKYQNMPTEKEIVEESNEKTLDSQKNAENSIKKTADTDLETDLKSDEEDKSDNKKYTDFEEISDYIEDAVSDFEKSKKIDIRL